MITIHAAMLVILGFLLAALLVLALIGPYRRRIRRFAMEQVKRTLPLTESEIRADKDAIRAEFAINVHKLEMKLEEAELAAARQLIEINRRDAKIVDLEQAIESQKLSFEEHQNARRVLEQAIIDRLPKVESRLNEARKLLAERDKEITLLSDTANKQTEALNETTQINIQQADELQRLRTALDTRAARNREAVGDPRFDGEVALRTEIEMLRARTREQQALISRLQSGEEESSVSGHAANEQEIARLKAELARVEAALQNATATGDAAASAQTYNESRIRELEQAEQDRSAEIASLKASLASYIEDTAKAEDTRSMAAKAEISALQAEADEHRRIIQALRAEVAGSNERLARQAQHFRDELRRLGSENDAASGSRRAEAEASRRTLAERIAAPRMPRIATIETAPVAAANDETNSEALASREQRTGTFLKALNGGANDEAAAAPAAREVEPHAGAKPAEQAPPRRARLLERISNIDKS